MTDAIRWKKPVIVTEHSQNGYDAQRYRLGWVFRSENIDSLVEALNMAIDEMSRGNPDFGFDEFIEAHSPFNVAKSIVQCTSDKYQMCN